jgi:uncharacterized Zn finger protein
MRYEWAPYVSVAERRRNAQKEMAKLRKKGVGIQPIEIDGRKIARTFWGQAWCDHLESFSDYANRLPRGRTYVRNGSVCHLEIAKGRVKAIVSGSDLYEIEVNIKPLVPKQWTHVKRRCAGQIGSLLELLQGKLSSSVMGVVTDRKEGLFPSPREISLDCDCPDWATMCKHVAAVMYGVGARLDEQPELLFLLRGVDHEELITADAAIDGVTGRRSGRKRIAEDDLADVFGIDLAAGPPAAKAPTQTARKTNKKRATQKTVRRKTAKKTVKKTTARKAAKATTKTAKKAVAKKVAKKAVKRISQVKTDKKISRGNRI